jgi:hypothetical protein
MEEPMEPMERPADGPMDGPMETLPGAQAPEGFFPSLKRWVRYLYFLRFSLALWLFAPLLCGLNMYLTTSLTSGIMTPETWQQFICVAFFLVSAGFVALISARVVLINGPERWDLCYNYDKKLPKQRTDRDDGRPRSLVSLIVNPKAEKEWLAFLLGQFWNFWVFGYLIWNAYKAAVGPWWAVWLGLLIGTLLAGFMWGAANAWYYWTYEPVEDGEEGKPVRLGANAARTILFPRSFFHLARPDPGKFSEDTIEGAATWLSHNDPGLLVRFVQRPLRFAARLYLQSPGYAYEPKGKDGKPLEPKFYEGHSFSILSIAVFIALYLMIWPLSAPVPAVTSSLIAIGITSIGGLSMVLFFAGPVAQYLWKNWRSKPVQGKKQKPAELPLFWTRIWLSAATIIFLGAVVGLWFFTSAERFPILATILILVIFLCWFLCGLSFFFDRYRVPVVVMLIVGLVLPSFVGLDNAIGPDCQHGKLWFNLAENREERYFSAISLNAQEPLAQAPVETPPEILSRYLEQHPEENEQNAPLIIVTSTGGGLHASAWTTAVLARLEDAFDNGIKTQNGATAADQTSHPGSFREHLLLASTVSGGSVGLMSYLRELKSDSPNFIRMQTDAQCSSLEAVGWGLVYNDMPKAFIPLIPELVLPLSNGQDDLDHSALAKDRTWSLRKGIARNVQNDYCEETWNRDHPTPMTFGEWVKALFSPRWLLFKNIEDRKNSIEPNEKQLTLRTLMPSESSVNGSKYAFPAFAMNTTAFETGARFLLANYKLADRTLDSPCNYRANSFLDSFHTANPDDKNALVSDLPLATAAQLSGTFPYVSSATRAPWLFQSNVSSVHFVDGGYYDNDGTASAVEFLRYALGNPLPVPPPDAKIPPTQHVGPCENETEADRKEEYEQNLKKFPTIEQRVTTAHPLRILLIEIRNSGDEGGDKPNQVGDRNNSTTPANLLTQLGAPLLGFWQAGHESNTGRNRIHTSQLEHALNGRLEIHRVVLSDNYATCLVKTDPLNWSLTPAQRQEVQASATGFSTGAFKTYSYKDPGQLGGSGDSSCKTSHEILDRYTDAHRWFFDKTEADWKSQSDSGNPE